MQELLSLVEDEHYRRQRLGLEKVRPGLGVWKSSARPCAGPSSGAPLVAGGASAGRSSHVQACCWRAVVCATCALSPAPPPRSAQVDWRAFGQHFGRSYESVSYKYSYIKNTGRTGEGGP